MAIQWLYGSGGCSLSLKCVTLEIQNSKLEYGRKWLLNGNRYSCKGNGMESVLEYCLASLNAIQIIHRHESS